MSPLDFLTIPLVAILLGLYVVFIVRLRSEKGTQVRLLMKEPRREIPTIQNRSTENQLSEGTTSHKEESLPVVQNERKGNMGNNGLDKQSDRSIEGKKVNGNRRKSFYLYGENDFRGCVYKLGHLNGLPKSTPIPDECFGCPEILKCLKFPSS